MRAWLLDAYWMSTPALSGFHASIERVRFEKEFQKRIASATCNKAQSFGGKAKGFFRPKTYWFAAEKSLSGDRWCRSKPRVGSLSKLRRRRQRERHQTKGLISKTIAVHVRYKSLYILCRPLQNNNVKWPSSASSTERGRRRLSFRISIWNWTLSLHI